MKKFISYRRVSTAKQGASGLGLEAQKEIISYFVEREQGEVIADYCEVHSGKDLDDCTELHKAIKEAKKSKDKPTMICVHTVIGFGSAKQGTCKVHGSPLGAEDGKNAKLSYGFDHDDFFIPTEVRAHFEETFIARGRQAYREYNSEFKKYEEKHPADAKRFKSLEKLDLSNYLVEEMPEFVEGSATSTRVASGKALNDYMLSIPMLVGGSADVAGSVMTKLNGGVDFTPEHREGHNVNWGIREFAMAAAQNGMLLHGGIRTYVGCFAVFSDYMKPAIRMAALSHLPGIYLFSHDSIAVGEDGPTHQPIEQLAMLRSIPNVRVIRPADERETYAAWREALRSTKTPTALILSRQNLPLLENSSADGVKKGAYVVSKEAKKADLVIIATGSEVALAIEAQKKLLEKRIDVRVVSMPSWEIFAEQDKEYRREVLLLPSERRVSVEMLSTFGWSKWAKYHMGIDEFGASAPAKDVIKKFDFTSDRLVELCESIIK